MAITQSARVEVRRTLDRRDGLQVSSVDAGLWLRTVIVDVPQREVILESRRAWLLRRRKRYRFDWIRAVTYGYDDWSFNPAGFLAASHNGFDVFSVGLRLHDDDEMRLFTFLGEGTIKSNDVWGRNWPHLPELDLTGSQERESRVYVELLSKLIGVGVVPGRSEAALRKIASCGRYRRRNATAC